ncbi:ORC-CDC6 family AAA ATPase [Desertibaculum subflavum]|uniref:ORC-CDC6 family AAA ATPase n=1 Tax=Desertibaculum subflavum TaxID=2268458 RepID=UPI000E67609A
MPIENPSERDFACFLCAKGKAKKLSDICPVCNNPLNVGSVFENQALDGYFLKQFKGRGYYGATYYGTNRIGKPVAIKIVPVKLYEQHEKSFSEEVTKYARLGSHPNIAELFDAGEGTVFYRDSKIPVYFVIMEWVEGVTLTEFCTTENINANVVYGAILDIASGIQRFEQKNLWHNDLNSDNILVKELTPEELQARHSGSRFILKIVDTGSALFRQAFRTHALNDLAFLARHIDTLVLAARKSSASTPKEDLFFLDNLAKIVSRLSDENPARRLRSAEETISALTQLRRQSYLLSEETVAILQYPFEYLNANDFPSDALIWRLFSNRFPWVRDTIMVAAQSTLITGPRGSGKTMILKCMRLKTRLASFSPSESNGTVSDQIDSDSFIGFFVSARLEIGNHSPITKLPPWMTKEETVLYFFHLLYLYEICDTLLYAKIKNLLVISDIAEFDFCSFLSSSLGTRVDSLGSAMSAIKDIQSQILLLQFDPQESSPLLSAKFLSEICAKLKAAVPAFLGKSIVFLLDDFSLPKVPSSVQKTLLPVIWNSGGGYTFRVTAHSESTEFVDSRHNRYNANRDFREVNLGAEYVNSIDLEKKRTVIHECIDDIFKKRFEVSRVPVAQTAQLLLGDRKRWDIAKDIRQRTLDGRIHGLRYYGWDTVVSLCSGDISYLIDLIGKMIDGIDSSHFPLSKPIGIAKQNKVIREYARKELYSLQDFSVQTCNLYEIALHFGKMSLFKLQRDNVGSEKRPAEYLRLEIQWANATDEVRNATAELLRNGVFVDGGFSTSSQGILARRLIFRKQFTPAFPTTFRSRDTFPMSARHFLDFVQNPPSFLRRMLSEAGIRPDQQQLTLDRLFEPSV